MVSCYSLSAYRKDSKYSINNEIVNLNFYENSQTFYIKIFNKNCFTVLYEIYLEAIWAHFLSEANPLKKVRSERTGRKQGRQLAKKDLILKYKVRSNEVQMKRV